MKQFANLSLNKLRWKIVKAVRKAANKHGPIKGQAGAILIEVIPRCGSARKWLSINKFDDVNLSFIHPISYKGPLRSHTENTDAAEDAENMVIDHILTAHLRSFHTRFADRDSGTPYAMYAEIIDNDHVFAEIIVAVSYMDTGTNDVEYANAAAPIIQKAFGNELRPAKINYWI